VAGGRGCRFGGDIPKQYLPLAGKPVFALALEAFVRHPSINRVLAVIRADDESLAGEALSGIPDPAGKLLPFAPGGDTRQHSVLNGLRRIGETGGAGIVLIHDAARPMVSAALIDRAIASAREFGAAIPGVPVSDTIKRVDESNKVVDTPPRPRLRAVQTPQAFAFDRILRAHERAWAQGLRDLSDDGALIEQLGGSVHVFEGDAANIKITYEDDISRLEARMSGSFISVTGFGFDVHAFGPGDHVPLGGVDVPHDHSVVAHSDGDVILHALTDALLGALAEGDIGVLFPPSDPQWKGAASSVFMAEAVRRVAKRGGLIDHLDVTLLCERPRLSPHRDAIRARIAALACVNISQVSVKATTTEKLGFTGRSEGIAAQAVASVRLPAAAP
jgi:2-C-methyl-D-erythritol 4-phosphate cytidylyltransferase/2-C-methyl-D-erythritol 2,4-cyclodiphosphate synthase